MKATKFILASAIIVAALSSCRKEEPIYYVEEGCKCSSESVLITVKASDWIYSDMQNNNYFYATVNMPEITSDVFKTGLIKMYRTYNFGQSDGVQIEMPYSRHIEELVDPATDEWAFYTESLDYEIGIGTITICYTQSDFNYELDETFYPDGMQFRCVIMK